MSKRQLTKITPLAGVAALFAPALAKAADYNYSSDYGTTASSSAALGAFAVVWLVFVLGAVIIGIALFIFWLIMLIDAFKRTNWEDENQKNLWLILLIVSIFVSLWGLSAILYYFIVKRALDKKPGKK